MRRLCVSLGWRAGFLNVVKWQGKRGLEGLNRWRNGTQLEALALGLALHSSCFPHGLREGRAGKPAPFGTSSRPAIALRLVALVSMERICLLWLSEQPQDISGTGEFVENFSEISWRCLDNNWQKIAYFFFSMDSLFFFVTSVLRFFVVGSLYKYFTYK